MSDFVKRVSEVSGRETGGTFRYGEMSAELSGVCNGVWWLIYRRRPSESARAGDVSHRAKQTELNPFLPTLSGRYLPCRTVS